MRETIELFRLFRREQQDPVPFYERLAELAADSLGERLPGRRVLDLGCGPGHYTRALRARGADVVPIELQPSELYLPGGPPPGAAVGDGMALPLRSGAVDGFFCSNMLEHTPHPERVLAEATRVVTPGGWIWLSWTNWYSPWGGHEMSPWHYLGSDVALRRYRRRHGAEPKNVPGETIFPLHIGRMMRTVREDGRVRLAGAWPRYYPSQRWLLRVPGLREIAAWNCVLLLERT